MKDIILITLTKEQREHFAETAQMINALTVAMEDGDVVLPDEDQQELNNVIMAVLDYAQARLGE